MTNETREELKGLERGLDGSLVLKTTGKLGVGDAFSRIVEPTNARCPEYIAGQMALAAGYKSGEAVTYEIRIKPKSSPSKIQFKRMKEILHL